MDRFNVFIQYETEPDVYKLVLYNKELSDIEEFLINNKELAISPERLLITPPSVVIEYKFVTQMDGNGLTSECKIHGVDSYE